MKVKAVVVSEDDMKMRISPSYLSFILCLSQVKNFPKIAIPNNLYYVTFLHSVLYPPNILCLQLKKHWKNRNLTCFGFFILLINAFVHK